MTTFIKLTELNIQPVDELDFKPFPKHRFIFSLIKLLLHSGESHLIARKYFNILMSIFAYIKFMIYIILYN